MLTRDELDFEILVGHTKQQELRLSEMYKDAVVVATMYCLPAQNKHTFYATIIKSGEHFKLLYTRNELGFINDPKRVIHMYRFRDALEMEGGDGTYGKFVCGIKNLDGEIVDSLYEIKNILQEAVQDSRIEENMQRLILDGWAYYLSFVDENKVSYFNLEEKLLEQDEKKIENLFDMVQRLL